MSRFWRVVITVLATYGSGFLGSLFVSTTTGGWYEALTKPFFMPPSWVFFPVWMILYGLMSIAAILVWRDDPDVKEMHGWVPLYFAHLLLNASWTIFFFGFHAILVALIDIVILFGVVILLLVGAYDHNKRAALLLVPYAAWVGFATILTATIWRIN